MSRSPFRVVLAELLAISGIGFGFWLIHNAFQAAADMPALPPIALGALDILLCFFLLGYLLRLQLEDHAGLPLRWVVGGVVIAAGFLGWIAALFVDSQRLLTEEQQHQEIGQQLAKMDDSLRHMGDAMANVAVLDRHAWDVNHDLYARIHDQLQASLRTRTSWTHELARIDEQVRLMHKTYVSMPVENVVQQRVRLQGDFHLARDRAVQVSETLRNEVSTSERDVVSHRRARWHAVGASALTGVLCLVGCLLLWLVFDRELRRSWRARRRLQEAEARYRSLIENDAEPLVLLDAGAAIVYANPAWSNVFRREPENMVGTLALELIHPDDRARVLSVLQSRGAHPSIVCRVGADYGIWHDTEMHSQVYSDQNVLMLRFREIRETPEFAPIAPVEPQQDMVPLQKLHEAEAQVAEWERRYRVLEDRMNVERSEQDSQRWLLGTHRDYGNEGLLILSNQGQVLSWNPAFAQLWKLSPETLAAHTWLTIAAHMETLTEAGWGDFHRVASLQDPRQTDSSWEMTLEGGKILEVYGQVLRDHPGNTTAIRFHFRDVTRQRELEANLRLHDENRQTAEATLRERDRRIKQLEKQVNERDRKIDDLETAVRESQSRVKQIEKQLPERDRRIEELEAALLEHQDRLHQMYGTHEGHEAALKATRAAMRRMASGVANEFNNVLSVVLGNTDVLRDNLPKDHVAQNYLEEIHQAAGRGTDLSQRLLAFSGNQLSKMTPIDINEHLSSLEQKIRVALGHVQLHWERESRELWAKTDIHPLEQAILQLASHVRTDMPNGGTMTIRTNRVKLGREELPYPEMAPGAYVRVQLHDTGAAIDEETLTHVLQPYQPLREGHKGDLSLATAEGILRQSGGSMEVASSPEDGTTWTLLLPETSERPQPTRASA